MFLRSWAGWGISGFLWLLLHINACSLEQVWKRKTQGSQLEVIIMNSLAHAFLVFLFCVHILTFKDKIWHGAVGLEDFEPSQETVGGPPRSPRPWKDTDPAAVSVGCWWLTVVYFCGHLPLTKCEPPTLEMLGHTGRFYLFHCSCHGQRLTVAGAKPQLPGLRNTSVVSLVFQSCPEDQDEVRVHLNHLCA